MRNYLGFDLRGGKLFPYWIATYVLILALAGLYGWRAYGDAMEQLANPLTPTDVFGWGYIGSVVVGLLFNFAAIFITHLFTFFVVKYSVPSISYGEERPEADYDTGRFVRTILIGSLLSAVTLGIYTPWFIAKLIRLFASNTYYRYDKFEFTGKGMTLFSFSVLLVVVPSLIALLLMQTFFVYILAGSQSVLVWMLLSIILLGLLLVFYQAALARWSINFIWGRKDVTSTVRIWNAGWFLAGQLFLTMVTLGFYGPMAMLRAYRYFISRTIVGEENVEARFGFTLNTWRDYGYCLGQNLLTIVTLGVYTPWCYANVMRRLVSQTYAEDQEKQTVAMRPRFE